MNFEIVDRSEVPPRGSRGGRVPSEASLALERGDVLFLPGATSTTVSGLRKKRSYLTRRGYKVRTRRGARNGTTGIFVWAEPGGAA